MLIYISKKFTLPTKKLIKYKDEMITKNHLFFFKLIILARTRIKKIPLQINITGNTMHLNYLYISSVETKKILNIMQSNRCKFL